MDLIQRPNGSSVVVIVAHHIDGNFSNVTLTKNYYNSECDNVALNSQDNTGTSYSLLISVTSSDKCKGGGGGGNGNLKWIAIGVVLGVLVIAGLIGVLMFLAWKYKAGPYRWYELSNYSS